MPAIILVVQIEPGPMPTFKISAPSLHNFIAASANVDTLDPEAEDLPLVVEMKEGVPLETIMSNSFGFGGTNVSLTFSRFES